MLAHVAGIPLEELLLWLVPLGGFAGFLAFFSYRLPRRRGRWLG